MDDKLNAAFWKWFGNSKVVDKRGLPLVVYHGTNQSFDTFMQPSEGGVSYHPSAYLGIFFSESPEVASEFAMDEGAQVMPVYLSIQKPYPLPWKEFERLFVKDDNWDELQEIAEGMSASIAADGYDGILIKGNVKSKTLEGKANTWVAFDAKQIKSALNRGTWDAQSASISANPRRRR